jgi:hypothetical protein
VQTIRFRADRIHLRFPLSAAITPLHTKQESHMFGRGAWAIFGLGKDSLEAFRTILEDRSMMVTASQLAASAVTRYSKADTIGVNPFSGPRLDEEHPLDAEFEPELAGYAGSEVEERAGVTLCDEILNCGGYGITEAQFRIHPELPWYGLWAVVNEWKDVSDVASVREQGSYRLLERPYKFLPATDKKTVEDATFGITAAIRKQIPVLLDFNEGRICIENTSKKADLHGHGDSPKAWTRCHPGRLELSASQLAGDNPQQVV